jgi:predicted nucleotidyltransferase
MATIKIIEHDRLFAQYNNWIKESQKMIQQTYPAKIEELEEAIKTPFRMPRVELWNWENLWLNPAIPTEILRPQWKLQKIYDSIDKKEPDAYLGYWIGEELIMELSDIYEENRWTFGEKLSEYNLDELEAALATSPEDFDIEDCTGMEEIYTKILKECYFRLHSVDECFSKVWELAFDFWDKHYFQELQSKYPNYLSIKKEAREQTVKECKTETRKTKHDRLFTQYNNWIKESQKMIQQTYPAKIEELEEAIKNPFRMPRVKLWDFKDFYVDSGIDASRVLRLQRELQKIYDSIDDRSYYA